MGDKKFYHFERPAETPLKKLVWTIKHAWRCEQAHEQMENEPALDRLECRGSYGLQHNLIPVMIGMTFLQHLRLGKEGGGPCGAPAVYFPAPPA